MCLWLRIAFLNCCKLVPLLGLPTALEAAEILLSHVFRNYGLLEDIVSDRGSQFISWVWKAFFRLLRVTVSLFSGYHSRTNGQTERKIQELGHYLRAYCHRDQHSWSHTYHPGQGVWLSTRDLRLRLPCKKLSPHFIVPFWIQRQINEVTYQLHLPPRYRIHPTFHGSRFKYLVDWEGYGEFLGGPGRYSGSHVARGLPLHSSKYTARPRRRLRVSGATLEGGGNVRDVTLPQPSLSPQSSTTTYTRSHSPVFWSPANLQSSLTHKHAAFSHSLSGKNTICLINQHVFHLPVYVWPICDNMCIF